MAVRVLGAALFGIRAMPVIVEVDLLRRLPGVSVVGLPAHAVRESAERIRSAILSLGLPFPRKRVVINLAPADVRKDGTILDLACAIGILAADGSVPTQALGDYLFAGELGLGNELRPIRGALSIAELCEQQGRTLIIPVENAIQASHLVGVRVLAARTLDEVVGHLTGRRSLSVAVSLALQPPLYQTDLGDVLGHGGAKRAMEVAAAGGHHVFFVGAPGCGKSLLARRLPSILPELSSSEVLEVNRIQQMSRRFEREHDVHCNRPFRAPHSSISIAAFLGDRALRPGELSLAHRGVLLLDEALEFRRDVLESLRSPLEEGRVEILRAAGALSYPAEFNLVVACNPCPCGYRGTARDCRCTDSVALRYQRKLSGPLLDRIDLQCCLKMPGPEVVFSDQDNEFSVTVRQRVVRAKRVQQERGQSALNARLPRAKLYGLLALSQEAQALVMDSMTRLSLSVRGVDKVLRVARTMADLGASRGVKEEHVAEALAFRTVGFGS